ncbi:hypothetical protein P3P1_05 [Pseudomonas aeruginosa]|nr:hypothetical protein P3P1_05 [Pseudomonas aeruginosa]
MNNQRIAYVRNANVFNIACLCWSRGFNYDMCKYLLSRQGFSPIQSMDDFQLFWNHLDRAYADYCNEHGCPADPIGFADVRN